LYLMGITLFAAAPDFRQALPGYRHQFPRDHFNHPESRTEWWYYTGNRRRLNRAGPGLAGAGFDEGRIWNGNWAAPQNRRHLFGVML
jgi:predicted secreted hydrolase